MDALLRLDVMDERIDSENLILLEAGNTTNDTNGNTKKSLAWRRFSGLDNNAQDVFRENRRGSVDLLA